MSKLDECEQVEVFL